GAGRSASPEARSSCSELLALGLPVVGLGGGEARHQAAAIIEGARSVAARLLKVAGFETEREEIVLRLAAVFRHAGGGAGPRIELLLQALMLALELAQVALAPGLEAFDDERLAIPGEGRLIDRRAVLGVVGAEVAPVVGKGRHEAAVGDHHRVLYVEVG